MTLLERCQKVRAQIEQRNALHVAHKDAEAFRKRISEVFDMRKQLATELARLVVLQKKGVSVGKPPTPTSAVNLVQEVKNRLASNPGESGKDYGRLKRSIDKVHKDLSSVTEKALDAVNRDLPNIEESFLKQVELIPTYTMRVAHVREQRDRLLRGLDLKSMTADNLEQFLESRNALRALADQLNPDEFPKEVLEFFKAERQGGAPLDKFTTPVREWLAEKDQLKNVRVVIKR